MSVETIKSTNFTGDNLGEPDTYPELYEYPHERGSDVALRIALAMESLSEANRTRPLADILAEDHPYVRVGETTFSAIMTLVAEHGFTTGSSAVAADQDPASIKTVA